MNYYEKYLKYKNKYNNLKIILGGSLKGEEKKQYIQLLHQLYLNPYDEAKDNCYNILLKHLLLIAYEQSQHIFNEYIEKIIEPKKSEIKTQYNKIYSDTIRIIKDDSHKIDIPEFNVRSLQIVILYTELIRLTELSEKTNMKNYFQQPNYKIDVEYDNFIKVWFTYDILYEYSLKSQGFKDIIYKKNTTELLTYKDINNSRIICYLDYITEKEIILSYVYNIYYLGINEKLDYADGRELTPFEFLHHDITHANNRGYTGGNVELEREFYYYLEGETNILTKEQYKQIYIIFFVIIHESMSEYFLESKINVNNQFDDISPSFIKDMKHWLNSNFYNGLLPKKPPELRTDETQIKNYLDKSFNLFKNEWNKFIEKKNMNITITFNIDELYQYFYKKIHFGYDPFEESEEKNKYLSENLSDDKKRDLTIEACKQGYVNSLISCIDNLWNKELSDDILFHLYLQSIFWEYNYTNNPVRIYLSRMYENRLNIILTTEMLSHERYKDIRKMRIVGQNLLYLLTKPFGFVRFEPFGDTRSSEKYKKSEEPKESEEITTIKTELLEAEKEGKHAFNKLYKTVALKYHPDKNKNINAASIFTIITNFYAEIKKKNNWN
jgi:hypothetical protein